MRGFPTGVAVVTTLSSDGEPLGFTCSSLCGLSLDPPLPLICVNNNSWTLRRIQDRGAFAVNLLSARGRRVAEVFATAVPDRFAQVRWEPTPGGGATVPDRRRSRCYRVRDRWYAHSR